MINDEAGEVVYNSFPSIPYVCLVQAYIEPILLPIAAGTRIRAGITGTYPARSAVKQIMAYCVPSNKSSLTLSVSREG